MTRQQALTAMTHSLALASVEDAEAATICLWIGAGDPAGAILPDPAGFLTERRPVWRACAEAIQDQHLVGASWEPDGFWEPVECGRRELVLATMIVQHRWSELRGWAACLLARSET